MLACHTHSLCPQGVLKLSKIHLSTLIVMRLGQTIKAFYKVT